MGLKTRGVGIFLKAAALNHPELVFNRAVIFKNLKIKTNIDFDNVFKKYYLKTPLPKQRRWGLFFVLTFTTTSFHVGRKAKAFFW